MATVLVVDDEPAVRDLVALMLEMDGFSVLRAANGADAIGLSRSRRGEIDLLVTDVAMPVMDGCTLAEELQVENPVLPVLLISGCCESGQEKRCRRFSVLLKPFSMASFLCLVRSLVRQPAHPASRLTVPRNGA